MKLRAKRLSKTFVDLYIYIYIVIYINVFTSMVLGVKDTVNTLWFMGRICSYIGSMMNTLNFVLSGNSESSMSSILMFTGTMP